MPFRLKTVRISHSLSCVISKKEMKWRFPLHHDKVLTQSIVHTSWAEELGFEPNFTHSTLQSWLLQSFNLQYFTFLEDKLSGQTCETLHEMRLAVSRAVALLSETVFTNCFYKVVKVYEQGHAFWYIVFWEIVNLLKDILFMIRYIYRQ